MSVLIHSKRRNIDRILLLRPTRTYEHDVESYLQNSSPLEQWWWRGKLVKNNLCMWHDWDRQILKCKRSHVMWWFASHECIKSINIISVQSINLYLLIWQQLKQTPNIRVSLFQAISKTELLKWTRGKRISQK